MKAQIDSVIEKRVAEAIAANQGEFKNLMVYQKLQNVLSDLGNQEGLHQLWKDVSPEEQANYLGKINIEFDTATGEIEVTSKALDSHDKPMYDWKLQAGVGSISEVRREHTDAPVAITTPALEETTAPAVEVFAAPVLSETIVVKPVEAPETLTPESAKWQDMEMQRDIAFKIVYFFIGFIIFTFGLLYAYYKVD